MPPFQNPTVLMTRPKEASGEFLSALSQVCGPFQPVISPAFELVAVQPVPSNFEAAIFTSRAAVSFAPEGDGRIAYCVGDATANAAVDAGYKAISAAGTARDLSALILARAPTERLLHVRGETSVGNVNMTLRDAGLTSFEIVAYRKQVITPEPAIVDMIKRAESLVIPLFSAETVSILATWPLDFQTSHVAAMSEAVVAQSATLKPAGIVQSERPDLASMVACIARLIA